jgi:sensor histidine kinase YesM
MNIIFEMNMSLFEKIVHYSTVYRTPSHLLFWVVVYLLSVSRNRTIDGHEEALADLLINCAFDLFFSIIATYFLAYLIIPKVINAKSYYFVVFYFLIGSYLIAALARVMTVHVLEPITRMPPFTQEPVLEILTDLPHLARGYFLPAFSTAWVFTFLKLIKDQYLVQKRALQLEKERAEAELKILRAQLNPHFLFNTLNNIYSLSLMNSPVTSKSIAGLSEILDHVLYRCNGTYVLLSAEITLLKNYIGLEKLRYDDRLQVNFHQSIDGDAEIAPLILLSLVENAFKYGAGEDIGNPTINIDLELKENRFQFMISNSFMKKDNDGTNEKIGLNNIRKQLDLIYPGSYELRLSQHEETFVALLIIHLQHPVVVKH